MSAGTATPAALAAYSTSLDEARREASLRRELPDAYADEHGYPPRQRQLDWMVRMGLWWSYAVPRYGATLELRSWPQICRALRLPDKGSARANKDAYENQLQNTLEYYARIDRVERNEENDGKPWATVYNGREGIGIVIRLSSAGVAQSVRTTESGASGRRPGQPPPSPPRRPRGDQRDARPVSSNRELSPPPAERSLGSYLPSPSSVLPNGSGRARGRKERARAERAAHVRRAAAKERARVALLIRRELRGDISDGPALVAELPWLADVHPVDLARVVVELTGGGEWPRLLISARWQRRLEVACRQIDRYANFGRGARGAAAAGIIALAVGGWQEWTDAEPYSLGGLAVCLRRWARTWRRHDRLRNDPDFAQRSLWLAERNRHRGLDPATGAA